MLSDDEKQEILADANDPQRRKDFAYARQLVEDRKLTTAEYIKFLTSTNKIFSQPRVFKKIEGSFFKL